MPKINTAVVMGGGVEISSATLAGAPANADLLVAGLKPDAQLVAVDEYALDATPVDRLPVATVRPGGGAVKVNADTTGNVVIALYMQRAS